MFCTKATEEVLIYGQHTPAGSVKYADSRVEYDCLRFEEKNTATTLCTAQSAPNHSQPNIQKTPDGKFVKPPGEAGRPNLGGFSLKKALQERGWVPENINKFIKDVKQEASANLDTSLTYKQQKPEAVKAMCTYLSSSEKWPILANYVDCWPVICALKLHLQYTAQASRRKNDRQTAAMVTPLDDVDVQDALEVATFLRAAVN